MQIHCFPISESVAPLSATSFGTGIENLSVEGILSEAIQAHLPFSFFFARIREVGISLNPLQAVF